MQLGETLVEHRATLSFAAVLAGIDHVQLAAPPGCEDEARRFFGELLGLEEVEKPEPLRARGGVWFRVGAQQLHVGVDPAFAPARKAHPAFAVTGYDGWSRASAPPGSSRGRRPDSRGPPVLRRRSMGEQDRARRC